MENQITLFKGEQMEESLRQYFLNNGYFVVRGVKFLYDGNDITDVDLFLYSRSSSLTRQRINVDIKNKKTPQALERVLWANGLMKLLNFDACIVATSESRSFVTSFGLLYQTTILDGTFLSKLRGNKESSRLAEEELLKRLSSHRSSKSFNKDWRSMYEVSKAKLLTEMDFSGFNALLTYLKYYIEKAVTDVQKLEDATRMIYITMSHLLVIIDFILKDIAFLDSGVKEKKLSDGFKFGNLGKDGVGKIIEMAISISGAKSTHSIMKSIESNQAEILKEFFSRNEIARNVFLVARNFEELGFRREFKNPNELDPTQKSFLSVLLDYAQVERRKFYELYPAQAVE